MNPGLIILTCRNNLALTKTCYASLLKQEPPVRILIMDNASTDGTGRWAHRPEGGTFAMIAEKPRSVARMWNAALHWAWRLGVDRALVLNNDTEILPETHGILAAWLHSHPDVGMVTCVSRRPGESLEYDRSNLTERPHPDFSCFMIRRSAWEAIGWFDENCEVAFAEDCCAHVEMHRKGIRAVCLNVPFLHHGSATVKSATPEEKRRICEAADRNREYFYRKYGKRIGTPEYDDLFTAETFGCEALQFNTPAR